MTTASPLPNPSMSGRSPYNANVVSPFMYAVTFCVTGSYAISRVHLELIVERPNERLGAVVVSVFEVRVRFRFVAVFHRQSGVSNIVPVVRVVYLGEAAFPLARQTYPTR